MGRRPPAKPPYRFLVAIGVVVLALLSMAVIAAIYPDRAPTATAGAATTPPRPTGAPPTPARRPPPPPAPRPSDTPAPLPGAVTGTYAVIHTDQELGGRFEVRINLLNSVTVAQPWVVTLAYPPRVTSVLSAWTVPGQRPPLLATNRPAFTLAGDQPIPARTRIG